MCCRQAEDVYLMALKSEDEMFHVSLYDWLLCKQMPEKLLSVSRLAHVLLFVLCGTFRYIINMLQGRMS